MEIKGKIKEISISEKQAKVILHPMPDFANGLIISSNQAVQMETVKMLSEGNDIVADCYISQGKRGTNWEGKTFYNINSIGLDVPVIQREDELQAPEKPVKAKTGDGTPSWVNEETKEQEQALAYTPESATMEIGRLFVELILAYKEYDKTFKK